MKPETTISIAFVCDDAYALPTGVAITSLARNRSPGTRQDIYVVATDVAEHNAEKLRALAEEGVNIHLIRASAAKYEGMHRKEPGSFCVASIAALLKFDLPDLLPGCDKVLFLDGDVLVRGDLAELFATDIEPYYAGVVSDSGQIYFKHEVVQQVRNYFNSGVMLLNLRRCREDQLPRKLLETKKTMANMTLMDQNAFNVVMEGQVSYLPIKYNLLYINLFRSRGKYTLDEINALYGTGYADLDQILADAQIIHFSSKDKPWKYVDVPLADEWFGYFLQSPFRADPLGRTSLISADQLDAVRNTSSQRADRIAELTAQRDQVKSYYEAHVLQLKARIEELTAQRDQVKSYHETHSGQLKSRIEELTAQRDQAKRNGESQVQDLKREIGDLRAAYEQSLSWKVTAPLRALGKRKK